MKCTRILLICSMFLVSTLTAATPSIKVINTSDAPIAFVLVATERGSHNKNLYTTPDLPLDVKNASKENTKVFFLHPREDVVIPNLRQNVRAYDRTLWVVPLSEAESQINTMLAPLGRSIDQGILQPGVKPFEVGSAKIAEISGKKNALKINTTGRLSEGAKALVGLATHDAQVSSQDQALVSQYLDELLSGATARAIQGRIRTRSASGGPTPKKVVTTTTKSAQGNPAGWPTIINGNKISFEQASKTLELSNDSTAKLRNYSNLDYDEKRELRDEIQNIMRMKQTNEKKAAYAFVRQYTDNFA